MSKYIYRTSRGLSYYLIRQDVKLKDGSDYQLYQFVKNDRDDALVELPKGYRVVERKDLFRPLLVSEEHSEHLPNCQRERVQKLAESADHEYYMSAGIGGEARAQRGMNRILQTIEELKKLSEEVTCKACQRKIAWQIQLQEEGLQEIRLVWPKI